MLHTLLFTVVVFHVLFVPHELGARGQHWRICSLLLTWAKGGPVENCIDWPNNRNFLQHFDACTCATARTPKHMSVQRHLKGRVVSLAVFKCFQQQRWLDLGLSVEDTNCQRWLQLRHPLGGLGSQLILQRGMFAEGWWKFLSKKRWPAGNADNWFDVLMMINSSRISQQSWFG